MQMFLIDNPTLEMTAQIMLLERERSANGLPIKAHAPMMIGGSVKKVRLGGAFKKTF